MRAPISITAAPRCHARIVAPREPSQSSFYLCFHSSSILKARMRALALMLRHLSWTNRIFSSFPWSPSSSQESAMFSSWNDSRLQKSWSPSVFLLRVHSPEDSVLLGGFLVESLQERVCNYGFLAVYDLRKTYRCKMSTGKEFLSQFRNGYILP